MKNDIGIYIHVPFCVRKCAYCDFYSITDLSIEKEYAVALRSHILTKAKELSDRRVDTVFFGGGTPSLLSSESFRMIIGTIRDNFDVDPYSEISLEANPATLDERLLETYTSCGVNRISVGFQSAVNSELRTLSRIHDKRDFIETYGIVRKSGIRNVNIDLMYGIPRQNLDSLAESLKTVIDLSPEHISVYGLKIEPETHFGRHSDDYEFPDEDIQCEMYKYIVHSLKDAGYMRYEFSNFSKPGCECRHNLKYWHRDEYIGFGPAASSFIGNIRYTYKRDLCSYIDDIISGKEPECPEYRLLSDIDVTNERIMLGLRLEEGIRPDDPFIKKADKYIKGGFMEYTDGILRFTDDGILVSNYILSDLII